MMPRFLRADHLPQGELSSSELCLLLMGVGKKVAQLSQIVTSCHILSDGGASGKNSDGLSLQCGNKYYIGKYN